MSRRPTPSLRRALAAALVLYGVMVQALLVGWRADALMPGEHPGSVLCQHEPGDDPRPASPAAGCCVAACLGIAVSLAPPPGMSVAWPRRYATRVMAPREPSQAGARPGSPMVSARGPPLV